VEIGCGGHAVAKPFLLAKLHLLAGSDEYTKDDEKLVQNAVDTFELEAIKMAVQA
jgi:hypothetical protein